MNRLQRFMYGRRGADQLSLALMICGVVLTFASSVVSWFATSTLPYLIYLILHFVAILLFVASIIRMFSRNIAARERENQKFLGALHGFTGWFKRDRKHYVYLRCAGCKAQLRVPKGKGTVIVTCPKCHRETKIKT